MEDSDFTLMTLSVGDVIQCRTCYQIVRHPQEAFLVVDDGEVLDVYCQPCLRKAEGCEGEEGA